MTASQTLIHIDRPARTKRPTVTLTIRDRRAHFATVRFQRAGAEFVVRADRYGPFTLTPEESIQ